MITLFTSIRKQYHSRKLGCGDPTSTSRQATGNASADGEDGTLARCGPNNFLSAGGPRLRTSTILKTFRTSVLGKKRDPIPSFEAADVNSMSSPAFEVCAVDESTNSLSSSQQIDLEVTLPHHGMTQIATAMLVDSPRRDASLPEISDLQGNGSNGASMQSPGILDTESNSVFGVSSPRGRSFERTEGDVTLVADTNLPTTDSDSSLLLEKRNSSKLSPLSSLAAYYELASIAQRQESLQLAHGDYTLDQSNMDTVIKAIATVLSESSSIFLTPMSPSDFDLAHDEIFGVTPPATPRPVKPL